MASGAAEPELNAHQLLPYDVKAVQQVTEYAIEKEGELKIMNARVRNMNLLQLFLDSKVPKCQAGILSLSLRVTDRKDIMREIEKHFGLYKSMIQAADKVEHENKTLSEKENPYEVIIRLNEKLTTMFEMAQSGIETTSSKMISKLYREFLDQQFQLENKIKKMECVFLKQQFLADSERLDATSNHAKQITADAIEYKEKIYSEMKEEARYLKKQNKELQDLVEQASKRLEYCEKHANLLKEKKLLNEN